MLKKIALASILLATPALATDKPATPTTNNFFQRLDQRLTNRVENNLAQQQGQAQRQQQGQAQAQTANANNSNNVNVDNRTRITNAPTVIGNGDTYGVSGAVAGVAFGAVIPSRAHGRGKIGDNIIRLSVDRTVLYTQCGLPNTHKTLMLKGIRCDLDGAELIAWEAQFRPKVVVRKASATHAHKRRAPRAKRCGC